MKLISFDREGYRSFGAVVNGGIVDLQKAAGGKYADLKAALAAGAIDELERLANAREVDYTLDEITYLPVIPNPDKIFCVGINYRGHMNETTGIVPESPIVFVRFANSQVGHREPFLIPPEASKADWEGEVAVIIGKGGRRIKAADAWDHVAGYAPYNEGTMRDHQKREGQWTPAKSFVGSAPFGPWMATRGEIADGAILTLVTRLNGEEVQRATSDDMLRSIPELIEYCSMFSRLEPGDVIATGTPGGVGLKRNPPLFMKDGDTIEVEIEEIGVLTNPVRAEAVATAR